MAVEAGRETLRASETIPTTVLFASTGHAYAEKLNAAAVHAALDLPAEVLSLDIASSSKSGLASLSLGALAAQTGPVLVCASDIVVGAPSGPRESAGGDAACSFLLGQGGTGAADILAVASTTAELLDVWRSPEQQFARQWEERFVERGLGPAVQSVFRRCLNEACLQPSDLAKVALDTGRRRIGAALARTFGLDAHQIAGDLTAKVGRPGSANAGLLLAGMLDEASPGDRLAVVSAADGAEAVIVEVSEGIERARPRHSVSDWIDAGRGELPYETYLKWRGILPFEPPRRPDPPRPAAPPMQRAQRWKYAFVGGRCLSCEEINLPPQQVCVHCGAVDQMDGMPYADTTARIATYTIDHLAYSLQKPVIAAVVDFDQGGRFACELADVEPSAVAIGQSLEMTFRRLYTAEGVHNYFWKARPARYNQTRS